MINDSHPENKSVAAEKIDFPGSPIGLNSRFYIERPPSEGLVYKELSNPGSLIRIRAPRQMGKSSMMLRLINEADNLGYQTVKIDFQEADAASFQSINKFLRWICVNIARQLKLTPNLDDYWDEDMGSKVSCTIYFEGYLLEQIPTPLVLVFNEVNLLFQYPDIAQDFFPLLRFWHEQARRSSLWQSLRLVLVHSTEIYVSLNINQSPFNVGLTVKLGEFRAEQVQDLAQRHGIELSDCQIQQLIKMVGGHPYLIHLALYHLYADHWTLEKLLQEAPTQMGIYKEHLQSLWLILQKKPEIAAALEEIIAASGSVELDPSVAYQLDSMGLIKLEGNNCIISCELYRLYFGEKNIKSRINNAVYLEKLEQENQKLHSLVYFDTLTQIANRRTFDNYFDKEWKRMEKFAEPMSLILSDIDYFKIYNDTYGHQKGDDCLRQIAQAICQIIGDPEKLVARYGGEEFVMVLPRTDATEAINIAEKVRNNIKTIAIPFKSHKFSGLPNSVVTISLGVACTIPQAHNPENLLLEADKALYQSKRKGRNCTTVSSVLNFRF